MTDAGIDRIVAAIWGATGIVGGISIVWVSIFLVALDHIERAIKEAGKATKEPS